MLPIESRGGHFTCGLVLAILYDKDWNCYASILVHLVVRKTASYVVGIACLTSTEGHVCVRLLLIAPVPLLRSSAAAHGPCTRPVRARRTCTLCRSKRVGGLSQLYSTRDHLVSEGLWELGGGERCSSRAGFSEWVDCKQLSRGANCVWSCSLCSRCQHDMTSVMLSCTRAPLVSAHCSLSPDDVFVCCAGSI